MSDPMHPSERDPRPLPAQEAAPRRGGASALLWILLLLAIIAIAWYFLGRQDATQMPPEAATPIGETTAVPSDSPVSTEPAARESTRPAAPANREARALSQPAPEYPAAAQRSGVEGTAIVRVDLDANGSPVDVELAQSSRSRDLDRAALSAVRGWTFEPAIRDGKPVASSVQVPVDFRLERQ
ncbi:energy transducer TonB [Luteimonas marina]|uniref:Protein TonB n=1 Tax=Luteimonas marina TaxID=488485 RepID=A0A5C5UCS7_9GAMM|nr:energy transducer TonB [Luteimonas marina]TWT23452.1 energy transducer TonB [Luteimonas marina]